MNVMTLDLKIEPLISKRYSVNIVENETITSYFEYFVVIVSDGQNVFIATTVERKCVIQKFEEVVLELEYV